MIVSCRAGDTPGPGADPVADGLDRLHLPPPLRLCDQGLRCRGNLGDAGLDLEVDLAQNPLLDGLVKLRVESAEHRLVGGEDEIVDLSLTLAECPPRLLGNGPGEGLDALVGAGLIALL